ncbi:hypothetical protein GCM10017044_19710 [Kordiimonas sediminis]|uniref:HTH cro/C1-type domain-containing protein n=1 Tax=Kordiimonas sediminis TaxID=1735581 RepID=A0A919AT68_9PROT|nr:helix-turn-helix transcriptional regulator [Kordiimonas sediminis]GHF24996.1 hypothetical protein GCM10017044_19710 [Kordiimonas sediminis]
MPDPIDAAVGREVAKHRKRSGYTQAQIGDFLGLTFQQIQKYEKGVNRISAGKLMRLANLFGVRVEVFFATVNTPEEEKEISRQEAKELANYYMMLSPKMQKEMTRFVKALANE